MGFDEFLKETDSLLGLQWRPFQRRGIKRKLERRIAQIGLSGFGEYLLRVRQDPAEQNHLAKILTITISRFFRDKEVFHVLETSLLPAITQDKKEGGLRIWSIGCASGEEPYTLGLLWKTSFERNWPQIHFSVLATDIDGKMLRRAEEGRYKKSSLREMPQEILENSFNKEDGFFILNPSVRKSVEFKRHDILREEPFPGMDIIFCRNLAFTYFSKESQMKVLKKIFSSLKEKGYLVIGRDESLPLVYPTLFVPIFPAQKIYKRFSGVLNLL